MSGDLDQFLWECGGDEDLHARYFTPEGAYKCPDDAPVWLYGALKNRYNREDPMVLTRVERCVRFLPKQCSAASCMLGQNIRLLDYVLAHGQQILPVDLCTAAAVGDMKILEYLMGAGYDLTAPEVLCAAVQGKKPNVVEWLHEHKCQSSDEAVAEAAEQGDIEMVKYLIKKGHPVTDRVMLRASLCRDQTLGIVDFLNAQRSDA